MKAYIKKAATESYLIDEQSFEFLPLFSIYNIIPNDKIQELIVFIVGCL